MGEVETLLGALADENADRRRDVATQIGELSKGGGNAAPALSPLLSILEDDEPAVRSAASTAIFWIAHKGGSPDGLPLLVRCLLDDDAMIRHDAAGALESFAQQKATTDPTAVPGLLENLGHANPHTHAAAIYCLGAYIKSGVAGRELVPRIEAQAGHADEGVRQAVERVLKSLSG